MALKGLNVLDLTRLLPGPLCTHFLTRLGARVIKVEGVENGTDLGDYTRTVSPPLFENLNAGKLGIALDLRQERGKELLKQLASSADIIVEGNRPGTMKKLGLDFETLSQSNKRLIYCSLSGYGSTGPLATRAGHDVNYQALAGLLGISGKSDQIPPLVGFQPADVAGAMQGVIGILAAVIERFGTGAGQFVDVSLCESSMALGIATLSSVAAMPKKSPAASATSSASSSSEEIQFKRGENFLDGGLPNYNIYETSDGKYFSVGSLEMHFWAKAAERIGSNLNSANDVAAAIKTKTFDEWQEIFAPLDVCIEPILPAEEVFSHPQHVARGVLSHPPPGSSTTIPQIVMGPRLSNHPPTHLPTAPVVGQHTLKVMTELGLSASEVNSLLDSKVIQAPNLPACPVNKPCRVPVTKGQEYWWCACGLSANQPFCDGSHKGTNIGPVRFVAEEDALYPFCGCKKTAKAPRCDGAHKKK